MVKKPRILIYDIETLPNIVATWGLFKQNVNYKWILKERSIICAAWKWLGEDTVYTTSILDDVDAFNNSPHNDKVVVEALHQVLSEADMVIAHNGDKFDLPYFNARAIFHEMNPLPKIPSVDTLKVARGIFRFNSNRLDYLGDYLGVGRKIDVSGSLWLSVLEGDKKAVKKMLKYNKQDVKLLEDVYLKLRPYMVKHPNINLMTESETELCPNCGSTHLQRRGFYTTRTSKYQRYRCKDCHSWSHTGSRERGMIVPR